MKFSIMIEGENFTHSDSNDIVRIGRSDENDCVLTNKEFSRFHCVVELQRDVYYITDLQSKNGITINGVRINANEKIALSSDMEVWLAGKVPISFKKDQPTQEFTTTTATVGGIDNRPAARKRARKPTYSTPPGIPKKTQKKGLPLVPIAIGVAVITVLLYVLGS